MPEYSEGSLPSDASGFAQFAKQHSEQQQRLQQSQRLQQATASFKGFDRHTSFRTPTAGAKLCCVVLRCAAGLPIYRLPSCYRMQCGLLCLIILLEILHASLCLARGQQILVVSVTANTACCSAEHPCTAVLCSSSGQWHLWQQSLTRHAAFTLTAVHHPPAILL